MNDHFIYFGDNVSPTFSFDVDTLENITVNTSVDLAGEELGIDTIEFTVFIDDNDGTFRNQDYATPIYYYSGVNPRGKFYLKQITRVGVSRYKVEGVSLIGLLDNETYYGAYYDGQKLPTVLRNILLSNGLAVYTGYYDKITTAAYTGNIGLATGTMKSQATNVGTRLFHSATMHSKMQAKFTLNGFTSPAQATDTTYDCQLVGMSNGKTQRTSGSDKYKLNYGLYMHVTRSSTSAQWPAFGTVYFQYGSKRYSLGTPSGPTTYEIDVDPVAGTAIINGTTYSITDSAENQLVPLHCGMGGVYVQYVLQSSSGSIVETTEIEGLLKAHGCNCTWEYYRLYDQSDNLLTDMKYLQHYFQSGDYCYVYDMGTIRTRYVNANTGASVDPTTYTQYTGNPAFFEPSQEMLDLYNNMTIEEGVADVQFYGRIPICTKREALHQVLFSSGINIVKTADGSLSFAAPTKAIVATLSEDEIYESGNVEYPEHVNLVEVDEYSFSAGTKETLFEATTAPSGFYIAKYEDKGLRYTNYDDTTIQEVVMNWNAAVVYGTGQLVGRPFVEETRTVTKQIANYPDGKTIKAKSCKFIGVHNSENILNKLASYYGNARKIKMSIIFDGERCGSFYTFPNPFNELEGGFLSRATLTASSVSKADCEFIVGYDPPGAGATYNHYEILSGDGTWNVPASVFEEETPKIHLVIIGGGNGGDGGAAGEDGPVPTSWTFVTPAQGGQAGNPGNGGKIFEITIENPPASVSYSCGAGGVGGEMSLSHSTNNPGGLGGNTTVTVGGTTYTSADGVSRINGIINSITRDVYAKRPALSNWGTSKTVMGYTNGYGNGGGGGYISSDGTLVSYVRGGSSIGYFSSLGQPTAIGGWYGENSPKTGTPSRTGGGGGGAGFGSPGDDGGDATSTKAGRGGDGGSAIFTPPKPTDYNATCLAWGGYGGGGGGGGGAAGLPLNSSQAGVGGTGGFGGEGGEGADGIVLVYY